jgi:D-alanyl-D-alanine dipeptidase
MLDDGTVIPFLDDGTVDMGSSFDLFHTLSNHDSPLLKN